MKDFFEDFRTALNEIATTFLFFIPNAYKKENDTVTRTIRISGETFDKISDLAEKNELSFNSVVNQIIEFGLKNLEES